MKKSIKKLTITLLLFTICFSLIWQNNVSAHSFSHNTLNSNNIQIFFDNFFEDNMKKYNVPGATVAVIKDGEEIFKKGYGVSNLEKNIDVNADSTSFPIASISKLFTAIAIMQLYENNKLDIYEDVTKYISPYKIENKYNKKVTCANLLTHSSGIDEESEINVSTQDAEKIKSQEYYFDTHPIKVVKEPDTICRYNNFGYNILGYIVERVSGISYEEYIKENILKPLNMNNTSVRIKDKNTSCGYEYSNNSFNEIPLAYQYTSGSSGIITTASDMEKFMLAIFNNGKLNNTSILNEETMKEMKKMQFSNSEIMPGMGFGFIRSNRNGKKIIKHEGGIPGFTSTMFLIEDENIGIFVSTNSLNSLPFDIEDEFLNTFFPYENREYNDANVNSNKDYSEYTGSFRNYHGLSKSTIMKIGFLFFKSGDITIKDNKDGTLTIKEYTEDNKENVTKLVETSDNVFVREDGKGSFTFKLDNNKVTYVFSDVSYDSFERIKFYESNFFNIVLILTTSLIFIISIIITILKLFKKNFHNKYERKQILLNCITSLLFLIGSFGSLAAEFALVNNNDCPVINLLYLLLTLLIIGSVLSIASLINLIYMILNDILHVKNIIYFSVLEAAYFTFIFILYYFNFLGFNI